VLTVSAVVEVLHVDRIIFQVDYVGLHFRGLGTVSVGTIDVINPRQSGIMAKIWIHKHGVDTLVVLRIGCNANALVGIVLTTGVHTVLAMEDNVVCLRLDVEHIITYGTELHGGYL
jgi:hypothetical protein